MSRIDSLQAAGEYEEVRSRLLELNERDPSDVEVLWRLARVTVDIGEDREVEERQADYYREALEFARAAVEADSTSSNAFLQQGVAAGRVALISGTRRKVELSRLVKESADQAIELDPSNDIAYHVRGRWNYEVASLGFFTNAVLRVVYGGLPEASYARAAADFKRALELRDWMGHRLELGRTYIELGEPARAREQLERVLSMQNPYDADTEEYRRQARELLEEVE